MASEKPLSKLDLVTYLQQGFISDPTAAEAPITSNITDLDVRDWVEELQQAPDFSEDRLRLLGTFQDVYYVSTGSPYLCRSLLRKTPTNSLTLGEITFRDYFTDHGSKVPNDLLAQMRERMFEKAPTAVVVAMIMKGKLMTDEEDRFKAAVSRALYETIIDATSVISAQFRSRIYSDAFLAQFPPATKKQKPLNVDSIYETVKVLQRLQYLVKDPNNIADLYDEGIQSAHHIAVQSKESFAERMKSAYEMPAAVAYRIHDHATTIDCRNQETWVSILDGVKNDFVASVNKTSNVPSGPLAPSYGSKAYNFTDMFDLQFNDCEDCCSVLGPSAYFVDLMEFLQASSLPGNSKTVLDTLLERRSDLAHLELSCSNCKNKVPYICIINEILESYVTNLSKGGQDGTTVVVNESETSSQGYHGGPATELTVSAIHQKQLAEQLYPIQTFPYNQALDTIEACLFALGSSRKDVMTLFQSAERLLDATQIPASANPAQEAVRRKGAAITNKRSLVAATLGLQPEDFRLICGIHIVHDSLLTPSQLQVPGRPPVHRLWGYDTLSTLTDMDESKGTGLCFVKSQLLPRSGLSFEELCQLLNTLYFGARLVLVDKSGGTRFTGQVSDMRLRALDTTVERLDADGVEKKQVKPIGPLTKDLCYELQSFIRLRNKLGWSISDLDTAISCLTQHRVESALSGDTSCSLGVSIDILHSLASLVQLSQLVKISAPKLLPLWGDISTRGKNSLYHQLCLSPLARQTGDYIFLPDSQGRFLEATGPLKNHIFVLQVVLNTDDDGLAALRKIARLDKNRDELTIGNLSLLYRYRVLSDLLRIEPEELPRVIESFPKSTDFFASPETTLSLVEEWRALIEKGWSPSVISDIVRPGEEITSSNKSTAVEVAASIVSALSELNKTWEDRIESKTVSAEDVDEICRQLFEPATALTVSSFVQGLQTVEEPAGLDANLQPLKHKGMPKRVTFLAQSGSTPSPESTTVVLQGMLTVEEKASAHEVLSATGSKQLLAILETLDAKSKRATRAIGETLLSKLTDPAMRTQAIEVLSTDAFSKPLSKGETIEAVRLKIARDRNAAFAMIALPSLRPKLVERMLSEYARKKYPKLKNEVFEVLWSDLVRVADGKLILSARQAVESLSFSPPNGQIRCVLFPQAVVDSGLVRFHLSAQNEPAKLLLNGVSLSLTKGGDGELSSEGIHLKTLAGQVGIASTIECSVSLKNILWSVDGTSKTPLSTNTAILDPRTVDLIGSLFNAVDGPAAILTKAALTQDEIQYMCKENSVVNLNLAIPRLSDLVAIERWRTLTGLTTAKKPNNHAAIISFLQTAPGQFSGPDFKLIAKQLATAMNWPENRTLQLLQETYLKQPGTQVMSLLQGTRGLEELAALQSMMRFLAKINGQIPVSTLFKIATPTLPGQITTDFTTATSVQQCLPEKRRAQCVGKLREKKRQALVDYLLQQDTIQAKGIVNADGLFEHFLIDVQMGSEMETTRMKQAISTIQLYVQRCLLGRERNAGVASGMIKRNKWAWMQQHSLWQAARRVFLYPENWLDPTLRDDKTDVFAEYESLVMQKDFSWGTFVEGIKKYVYALSGVADLDIQAYLRENHQGKSDTYHFFGRTRNAPYSFYYRKVAIDRTGREVLWSPWSKIELDTLTYEADWDGQTLNESGTYLVPVMRRNRLFLFMPQIMIRTQQADHTADETFHSRGTGKIGLTVPAKKWEVRMAWTELLDGKWTPKRVSQSSLILDITQTLPSIASFTFDVSRSTDDELTIAVGCWRDSGASSYLLGYFSVQDDRVVVTTSPLQEVSLGTTLPTKFHKYTWANNEVTQVPTGPVVTVTNSKKEKITPLLAVPYQHASRTLTWTLSYGGDAARGVTGLVVDELNHGKRGTSMFFYSKQESFPDSITSDTLVSQSYDAKVAHGQVPKLIEAVCEPDGLKELFAKLEENSFDDLDSNLKALDFGSAISGASAAGRHELTTPFAVYNWELGLHTVMLAMDRFLSTQQFDLALDAARLVFDPTVAVPATATDEERATACWKFPPFREVAAKKDKMKDKFSGWPTEAASLPSDLAMAVAERRSNPLNAHATARGRTQAYMKWVIMKYICILVAAGDEYFRRNSLETLPLAIQRYVEAAYVLGPEPPKVPKLGKTKTRTFADFEREVDLELAFPFMCDLDKRGKDTPKEDDASGQKLLCLASTTYFCLPPNPQYQALRDLVNDRLYKTRNSLDIHGRKIVYAINEPYLDPALLMVNGLQTSASGLSSVAGDNGPAPFLRFQFLVAKAQELCSELRATSDQLLSAREKRDGEALAILRARQDLTKQNLALGLKQLQQDELEITLQSLRQQREGAVNQLKYYLQLSGEPFERIPEEKTEWEDIDYQIEAPTTDHLRMSPQERLEMACTDAATGLNTAAQGMDMYVSVLRLIPGITTQAQPMGMGVAIKTDASIIADSLAVQSQAMRLMGGIASDRGAKAARIGGLTRQLQERRLQANIKGREIKNIDKQIEGQLKRIETNEKETAMQKQEIEFADQVHKWYEGKFTNEKLYSWLEASIRTTAYDLYTLAMDTAKQAENAFVYERRNKAVPQRFLRPAGYWDGGRDGLLAGQQLSLDLRRMESSYLQNPSSDFQVTKTISLRQIDPLALLRLRETGATEFNVTEMLFDFDFPGHYLRRIKSVSVSLPCLLGPHTNIAGTLTLLEHRYRVSDIAGSGAEYTKTDSGLHFRADRVPISSVAISSGIQDSGVFELNFRDEKLVPFEGAGAISNWRLELPTRVRQFDYHSISDVVLHLRYTALQGSPLLRQAANEAVDTFRSSIDGLGERQGLFAFFDLKSDLAHQWSAFQRALAMARNAGSEEAVTMELGEIANRMPFWVRGKTVTVQTVAVAILSSGAKVEDGQDGDAAGVDEGAVSLVLPQAKGGVKWTGKEVMDACTVLTANVGKTMDGWKLVVKPTVDELRTISVILRYTTSDL